MSPSQPTLPHEESTPGLERPATAFLSYAREDKEEITSLQQYLKVRGLRAWRDVTDLALGGFTRTEIIQAIEQESDTFVIYVTPQCLTSDFIWDVEVPAALCRQEHDPRFHIVPVLRGVSFAELQLCCMARGYRSLTEFNGIPLPDPTTAQTQENFKSELRSVAERTLKAALTVRLRRAGADRNYYFSVNIELAVRAL